jgi:serine phosphatase RsbU (regulator of sigma subunit)
MLEPAYEFGGDNFDYAVDEGHVTISITDAMGHGLTAAVIGNLTVNAFRNARRAGAGLVDQAVAASKALESQFHGDLFVSGVLMDVDLASGEVSVVNAGHPPGYWVRGGAVEELAFVADYPMGMFPGTTFRLQSFTMQPRDRLVLVSDGVLEAAPESGEQYGIDRFTQLLAETASLSPAEVVRLAVTAVLEHRGEDLRDDATVLVVDKLP